jgi:hypothetical protein
MAIKMIEESTAISVPFLQREPKLSLAHAQRFSFLIMEQSCGLLSVEMVPRNTGISAPILPSERELSLAHAQR